MNQENQTSTKIALLRPDDAGQPRTPLYHQIFLILRQQILDGVHAVGERLPTEQEITKRYGVSRITAKRALDELASAGYVERASLPEGAAMPLSEAPETAPYFSMILIYKGDDPWLT